MLDPASSSKFKRKPLPHDPVLPTKEAFIKAKYVDHAFIRKPSKDDEPWSLDDVNKQLWSCVRTAHVDTTLRLVLKRLHNKFFWAFGRSCWFF
ncbi:hypothetical protein ANCDUO_04659 [Ancylostoma duodenale]|uniref:Uncharacterized protein n=1 Tax=Ancylostoma duodenale TaxID=51022 RepID=A0A0C2D608_9BILA|nr:hypothetical protein ANCDUO_04659 [Ancylostoma duodenale]